MEFQIEGVKFLYMKSLQINRSINNHTNCKIELIVEDNIDIIDSYRSLVSTPISLKALDLKKEKIIFVGYIEKVSVEKQKHSMILKLECYSNSKKNDKELFTYIFQEAEKTLGEIVKKIELKDIEPMFLEGELENRKIEKVILQDNESNFSFLKKILNQNQIPFIVESLSASTKIWIGKRKGNSSQINNQEFEIEFQEHKNQIQIKLLDEFYEIGDILKIKSANYYIIESEIEYIGGGCYCSYTLLSDYAQLEFHPFSFLEKSFVGEVIENKDPEFMGRLQVKFKEDKKVSSGETCWIKILVPYSTKEVGFFMTPSKGDKVLVNFSDEIEPLIIGSMRENGHENFENTNDLFIKNEFGKEFNLKEKEINIVSVFDNIFITLDEEKIEINNDSTGIYIEKDRIVFQNQKGAIVIDDKISIQTDEGAKMILDQNIASEGKELVLTGETSINGNTRINGKVVVK